MEMHLATHNMISILASAFISMSACPDRPASPHISLHLLTSPHISQLLNVSSHLLLRAHLLSAHRRLRGGFRRHRTRPDHPRLDLGGWRRGCVCVPRNRLSIRLAQVRPCGNAAMHLAAMRPCNPAANEARTASLTLTLPRLLPPRFLSPRLLPRPRRCTQQQIAILNMKAAAELAADLAQDGTGGGGMGGGPPTPKRAASVGASVGTSTRRGFGRDPRASGAAGGAGGSGEGRKMPGLIELDEIHPKVMNPKERSVEAASQSV